MCGSLVLRKNLFFLWRQMNDRYELGVSHIYKKHTHTHTNFEYFFIAFFLLTSIDVRFRSCMHLQIFGVFSLNFSCLCTLKWSGDLICNSFEETSWYSFWHLWILIFKIDRQNTQIWWGSCWKFNKKENHFLPKKKILSS